MLKVQEKIRLQATKPGVNVGCLNLGMTMANTIAWEKAWPSFKYQVLEMQKESMKLSSISCLYKNSKANTEKEQPWMAITDYISRSVKIRAKRCAF